MEAKETVYEKLKRWWMQLWAGSQRPTANVVAVVVLLYLAIQLGSSCLPVAYRQALQMSLPYSDLWIYVGFGVLLARWLLYRIDKHTGIVNKERLEDESEVQALFVEAKTVDPSCRSYANADSFDFSQKRKELLEEVQSLEDLGSDKWTEYKVLPMYQMLVDFLKPFDLDARVQLTLDDIEEYAIERYDRNWFHDMKEDVDKIRKDVKENKSPESKPELVESLRAKLKKLQEYVADYDMKWAEGTAIIKGLTIAGVVSIPIILAMALLPLYSPNSSGTLEYHNWALLGIIGAVSQFLLDLRKSNRVEVGDRKGKEELQRAILGAALGLVAGILLYSMITGNILAGVAFPEKGDFRHVRIAKSIFWGIASGFGFEWVFARLKQTTVETS